MQHNSKIVSGDWQYHYWITPPELYKALNDEFNFDFDPFPYPVPEGFNGLTIEWGQRNYVSPPFFNTKCYGKVCNSKDWFRKAIEEQRKGKLSVIIHPLQLSYMELLQVMGAEIRNLGSVKFEAIEDRAKTWSHRLYPIAAFILRG